MNEAGDCERKVSIGSETCGKGWPDVERWSDGVMGQEQLEFNHCKVAVDSPTPTALPLVSGFDHSVRIGSY